MGIEKEAIEFEWTYFPKIFVICYSSRDPNIKPEEFKDRIIFMSMFNDIDWSKRKNDEDCISNAEKVKECAMKFKQGHWTFRGPRKSGREVVWEIFLLSERRMGFHSRQNGTAIPRNWSLCVQKHQCSESRNPLEEEG